MRTSQPLCGKNRLAQVLCGSKRGPSLLYIVELLQRYRERMLLTVAVGPVEPIIAVVGIHLQRMRKVDDSTVVFLFTKARHGSKFHVINDKRVYADSSRAVALGTLIVLKMILRQCAEVPRFILVGPQADHTLEYLQGYHIVALVELATPLIHKFLNIVLCHHWHSQQQ